MIKKKDSVILISKKTLCVIERRIVLQRTQLKPNEIIDYLMQY